MKRGKILLYSAIFILFTIYFLAGITKIFTPAQFYQAVRSYGIVREPFLVAMLSSILPFFEVFCALFLLIPSWRKSSSLLIFLMTVIFLFAIVSAYLRGLAIDCGCFGGFLIGETGVATIVRNIFLATLSGLIFFKSD